MIDTPLTDTRVTLDSIVGPYDCKATGRCFRFSLDATRQVSAGTLEMADSYGFTCVETIHVIDGHQGSPDTVHVIDSGETYEANEEGDRAPRAVAVRIRWRGKTPTATPIALTAQVRRAARKTKSIAAGRGAAARSVVLQVSWEWVCDEGSGAVEIIKPVDGFYPIGGPVWPWCEVTWDCACGDKWDWRETECICGRSRDTQDASPLEAAARKAGNILRHTMPEATSALVDLTGSAYVYAVLAGDREVDTTEDTGMFDSETLGAFDEVLRQALEGVDRKDLAPAGWVHIPDDESAHAYRIDFPALGQ